MDTTVVKMLLAVAILFVLWKTLAGRRGGSGWSMLGGGSSAPAPYDPREYFGDEDEDDEEEDDSSDADDNEEEEDDYEEEEDDYEEDDEDDDYAEGYASPPGNSQSLLSASAALLPKPESRLQNFAEFAPKALKGQNFLDASKYIGVNTIGGSLRNANYDLRSAPSIPRKAVGPWSQSTIDPDPYRKPLE